VKILRKYRAERDCEDEDDTDYSCESKKWQIACGGAIL
jgi:hypothetical protein